MPPPSPRRRALSWLPALFAVAAWVFVLGPALRAHLRAGAFLSRAAGVRTPLSHFYEAPIRIDAVTLETEHGPVRARVYRPADGRAYRAVVLAHGVQYRGIDEPRLLPFARNLASTGFVVLTPELSALTDYRVATSSVDELRASVRWLRAQPYAAPGGVGLFGLSFAGGLSLLAAGAPDIRDDVAWVMSVGGHHDLARVSRFLATDELVLPEGTRRMHAHDYGLLVFFYAHTELFISGEQLPLLRDALRATLHEDHAAGRRVAAPLTGQARTLFEQLDRNDKPALAPLVLRAMPALREEMSALSPAGHLAGVRAPVYLLHGAGDDVMPPSEPAMVARELATRGDVYAVISPAVKHVTVEGPLTPRETWRILHMMASLLAR